MQHIQQRLPLLRQRLACRVQGLLVQHIQQRLPLLRQQLACRVQGLLVQHIQQRLPLLRQRLACRVQGLLVQHIQQRLPELRQQVADRQQGKLKELAALGDHVGEQSAETLREALLRYLTAFARNFSDGLQGKPWKGVPGGVMGHEALVGGARIRHVFQAIFCGALDALDSCNGLTDEQVRPRHCRAIFCAALDALDPCNGLIFAVLFLIKSLRCQVLLRSGWPLLQIWATMNNCAGVSRDIILSKEAFEVLVRSSLQQLASPGHQCLSMVTRELLQLAAESAPTEVARCAPRSQVNRKNKETVECTLTEPGRGVGPALLLEHWKAVTARDFAGS